MLWNVFVVDRFGNCKRVGDAPRSLADVPLVLGSLEPNFCHSVLICPVALQERDARASLQPNHETNVDLGDSSCD